MTLKLMTLGAAYDVLKARLCLAKQLIESSAFLKFSQAEFCFGQLQNAKRHICLCLFWDGYARLSLAFGTR